MKQFIFHNPVTKRIGGKATGNAYCKMQDHDTLYVEIPDDVSQKISEGYEVTYDNEKFDCKETPEIIAKKEEKTLKEELKKKAKEGRLSNEEVQLALANLL